MLSVKLRFTAAALVLGFTSAARAETYHDIEYHYTLELPAGWSALSMEEVRRANGFIQQMMPGMDVNMVTGFRSTGSDLSNSTFVLVQVDKRVTEKMTLQDLERDLTRDLSASRRGEPEASLRVIRRLLHDRPEFDYERNRYTLCGLVGPARGRIHMSVGYLGPENLVIFHGFTRPGGTKAELDPVVKLTDSFQFDQPKQPEPAYLDKLFGDRIGPLGRMVIIGSAIALLILIVGAITQREKPRPIWPYGRM